MSHTLEECELSTSYQDSCDTCGELTACVCLGSIVQEWTIEDTGRGDGSVFSYRYQFRKYKSDTVGQFGYAETYRQAMDAIAHAAICGREGADV